MADSQVIFEGEPEEVEPGVWRLEIPAGLTDGDTLTIEWREVEPWITKTIKMVTKDANPETE